VEINDIEQNGGTSRRWRGPPRRRADAVAFNSISTQVLKKDFTCCVYQKCCKKLCQGPAPGDMPFNLGATPARYAAVTTAQPGFV
jgi:hypothetical protein